MPVNYLNEAFQRLSLLEDEIPASEIDWKERVKKYLDDDVAEEEEEEIIDPEAVSEADLQDSYVGKVIIECNSCHTRIYKDQEDLVVEPESDVVTVEEVCPVCGQDASGWTVIGKIEPFNAEQEFPEDGEPVEAEVEDDIEIEEPEIADDIEASEDDEEDEFGEAFKAAFGEACGKKEELEEEAGSCLDDICPECGEQIEACKCAKAHKARFEKSNISDHREQPVDESLTEGCHGECEEHEHEEEVEEGLLGAIGGMAAGAALGSAVGAPLAGHIAGAAAGSIAQDALTKDEELEEAANPMMDRLRAKMMKMGEAVEEEPEIEESLKNAKFACEDDIELDEEKCPECGEEIESKEDMCDACKEKAEKKDESLGEELHIEASGEDKVEVHKNDDGSVSLEVGAGFDEDFVGDPADDIGGEEMIAPIDAEQAAEIEAQTGEEEAPIEEPVEDELAGEEEIPAEEGEEDMAELEGDEFDEFQEESFDYLGEAYLRKVYENVNSFKTTDVKLTDNGLVVEGLIKFESGKEKATEFVFENMQKTKRGKFVFEGLNSTFSNSNKAFTLKGNITDSKFVCESMIYNYTTKTLNESNENESVKVYGRVVVKA